MFNGKSLTVPTFFLVDTFLNSVEKNEFKGERNIFKWDDNNKKYKGLFLKVVK